MLAVLPLPHKKATGFTPPTADAVHTTLPTAGVPIQETVSAPALATPTPSAQNDPIIEASAIRNFIITFLITL